MSVLRRVGWKRCALPTGEGSYESELVFRSVGFWTGVIDGVAGSKNRPQ